MIKLSPVLIISVLLALVVATIAAFLINRKNFVVGPELSDPGSAKTGSDGSAPDPKISDIKTPAEETAQESPDNSSKNSIASPNIKIAEPRAGSVFSLASAQIAFSWTWSSVSDDAEPVVELLDKSGNVVYGKIGKSGGLSYSKSGGSGLIPAPADLAIPAGRAQYQVRVCVSAERKECGVSGYFTIIKVLAVNTDVTINVTAPKSGTVLEAGQIYNIKWTNSGLPQGAIQTITVFNGTKGTPNEPSAVIASGLGADIDSYTWTVKANNGWALGSIQNFRQNIMAFLGVATAYANTNQYVIRISANAPGALGSVGSGVSSPFIIKQPLLETECVTAGGAWDEDTVNCECPSHYYWYENHGCLPGQGQ